jgi:hypothetical protein
VWYPCKVRWLYEILRLCATSVCILCKKGRVDIQQATAVAEAPGLAVLILFLALDPVSLLEFNFLLAREICPLVRSHVLPDLLLVRCLVTCRVLPLLLKVLGGRLVCVHHVEATLRWHLLKVVLLAAPQLIGRITGVGLYEHYAHLIPSDLRCHLEQSPRASLAVIHLVLVVVPALAQGQARAADVYHVVQVVRDLVDLAVGVAIVCHIVY